MDRNFSKETDNFEDLTNAEALYMQLFSIKLDVVLAENKKMQVREFERKPNAAKETVDFKLDHHKERYYFLSNIETNLETDRNLTD